MRTFAFAAICASTLALKLQTTEDLAATTVVVDDTMPVVTPAPVVVDQQDATIDDSKSPEDILDSVLNRLDDGECTGDDCEDGEGTGTGDDDEEGEGSGTGDDEEEGEGTGTEDDEEEGSGDETEEGGLF